MRTAGRGGRDAERTGTPAVVVIDDDEAARSSIAQMLRLRGYAVEDFESAERALLFEGLDRIMCVVTDVKMPGLGGEEFLLQFKRLGHCAPVIMITGHGDVSMAVRCLKTGIEGPPLRFLIRLYEPPLLERRSSSPGSIIQKIL